MELTQALNNNFMLNDNNIQIKQEKFIDTTFGKIINSGLNAGLRLVLPNIIEDEVINIKDQILKNGFKSGIKEGIKSAKELRKSNIRNCYRKL